MVTVISRYVFYLILLVLLVGEELTKKKSCSTMLTFFNDGQLLKMHFTLWRFISLIIFNSVTYYFPLNYRFSLIGISIFLIFKLIFLKYVAKSMAKKGRCFACWFLLWFLLIIHIFSGASGCLASLIHDGISNPTEGNFIFNNKYLLVLLL